MEGRNVAFSRGFPYADKGDLIYSVAKVEKKVSDDAVVTAEPQCSDNARWLAFPPPPLPLLSSTESRISSAFFVRYRGQPGLFGLVDGRVRLTRRDRTMDNVSTLQNVDRRDPDHHTSHYRITPCPAVNICRETARMAAPERSDPKLS
ncbi:uncharacterized protein N7498_009636 [Penicillium cinerascens]|uniref:Uncharacterized protein n=1 Tax=Penicillium cinerascens TaxID=70096 RepID=A0A9W9JAC3_9EURO|nr:uncharacterized protein N7498_009636 [Penicillium cinerascens]KAJ5190651.1 hypothetical protein N7498_009636 [Penicillium cinerascens]